MSEGTSEERVAQRREEGVTEPPEAEETAAERWRSNVRTILGAVALALLIRIVLFEAFEIDGPSMEPTLLHGDRVVVAKCVYGLFLPGMSEAVVNWDGPELGDVVIVKSPWDEQDIVKRVVAVAGDTVEVHDHTVVRNGTPIPARPVGPCLPHMQHDIDPTCMVFEERLGEHVYHVSRGAHSSEAEQEPLVVPEGHVYVMGDHRDRSNDSRNLGVGPVPVTRIKGRALFIYVSSAEEGWRGERIGEGID